MQRDIVQFVPYRDFKLGGPERLAQEVLAEIPEQLLGFMQAARIVPGGDWAQRADALRQQRASGGPGPRAAAGAGGSMASEHARRIQADSAALHAQRVSGATEAELLGVRVEMADVSGAPTVLHAGWLDVQFGDAKAWLRHWCRLVAFPGRPCSFEVCDAADAGLPTPTPVLAAPLDGVAVAMQPFPKTARADAPDAFRMNFPDAALLGGQPQQAGRAPTKLILNPCDSGTAYSAGGAAAGAGPPAAAGGGKRSWLLALAGAEAQLDIRASSHPMHLSIPDVTVEQGHATYHVLVVDGMMGGFQQMLAGRRYTEFHQLHQALRARYHKVVKDLPPKRIFNNTATSVMETRRQELQAWLRMLSFNPKIVGDRTFREFVGLSM
jgi:hypothetical protein